MLLFGWSLISCAHLQKHSLRILCMTLCSHVKLKRLFYIICKEFFHIPQNFAFEWNLCSYITRRQQSPLIIPSHEITTLQKHIERTVILISESDMKSYIINVDDNVKMNCTLTRWLHAWATTKNSLKVIVHNRHWNIWLDAIIRFCFIKINGNG